MVKKFKIKLDGGNIKVFGKPNANQVKELKEKKADIIDFLKEEETNMKAESEKAKEEYFKTADLRKAITVTSDGNGSVRYWIETLDIIDGVAYTARYSEKQEISEAQYNEIKKNATKIAFGTMGHIAYLIQENTEADKTSLEQEKKEKQEQKEKMYQKREIETKKRNAELAKSGFCEKCNSWCYGDC